jgi:hypothetical protein
MSISIGIIWFPERHFPFQYLSCSNYSIFCICYETIPFARVTIIRYCSRKRTLCTRSYSTTSIVCPCL